MLERFVEVAARVVDAVRAYLHETGEAVFQEVARIADAVSRGEIADAVRGVTEGVRRIVDALHRNVEPFLAEVARVTGLEVAAGALVEAVHQTGRFLYDALTGKVEVPIARVVPILVCLVAAGALAYRGNIGGAVRYLVLALEGVSDLATDFEYAEAMRPYDLPEPLRGVRVAPEERPFDLDAMRRQLEDLFGPRHTVRDHAEAARTSEGGPSFEDQVQSLAERPL